MTISKEDRGYAGPKMHTESDEEYADRIDQANAAHTARPSIWVRGESGAVWEMDLPLPESIQDRLNAGKIQRVNEDGTTWSGVTGETTVTRGSTVTAGAQTHQDEIPGLVEDDTVVAPARPSDNAGLPAWKSYAVSRGASEKQADGMTKPELIKAYG
jgi:hypothetical protein